MSDASLIEQAFDASRAEVYDDQFVPLSAVKDLMHLIVRMHFSTLPKDASILVAGAGTGAEVRFLAPLFPDWHFTLVDPSRPMLEVAKRHAQGEGLIERCTFYPGFVSTSPEVQHDAATSILVSHFLTDTSERAGFFSSIARRLKPGGRLFNADLCQEPDESRTPEAMRLWLRMLEHAGALSDQNHDEYRAMFGRDWAAHAPAEVDAMITRAGFTDVLQCYQAGFIRGWTATRSGGEPP